MRTEPEPAVAPEPADASEGGVGESRIDAARVRSLIGLIVARLGPRAFGVVSGTFLALLVASRTSSLFAVTFALTAHRILSLVAYPLVGRWSDSSHTAIGKRLPFMAAGLAMMGGATFLMPESRGYWSLVGLIIVARQARVAYTLPNLAATPEVFGRSRWLRALIAVGVGGLVIGIAVRVTVIATWQRDDPTTWAPAFRLAAGFMLLGALALVFLVREAPATKVIGPASHQRWRDQLRDLLATPNARIIAVSLLLTIAASGATDRVYPVYAERVLGASGGDLALFGFLAGPLGGLFGVPVGLWLAAHVPRRRLAVFAPLGGVVGALAHLWVTKLWQSIAIGVVTAPLLVACVVAFAPFALSVIPKSGGMTERVGVLLGPFGMVGVAAGYTSSLAYDHLVHDYRVIWVVAAAITGAIALVLPRVRVPVGHELTDVRGMLRDGMAAMRLRLEDRTGLFTGEVTKHDADTTDFVESLRQLAVRYGLDDGTPDGPPLPGTLL